MHLGLQRQGTRGRFLAWSLPVAALTVSIHIAPAPAYRVPSPPPTLSTSVTFIASSQGNHPSRRPNACSGCDLMERTEASLFGTCCISSVTDPDTHSQAIGKVQAAHALRDPAIPEDSR